MRRISFCLLGSVVVLLTGCANNLGGHVDCNRINWYRLGYQDGKVGNYRQNLATTFSSCGSNLIVNETEYKKGWHLGLKVYCTPQNGMRLGQTGEMYNNICPMDQVNAFDSAWRQGLREFCVPRNGYRLGLEGNSFPSFCARDLNPAFHRAYRRGAEHYQKLLGVLNKLNTVSSEFDQVHQERIQTQRRLHRMQLQYSQQSFNPQTQYQIQKMNIKKKYLMEKENTLKTEKEKYQTRYDSLKRTFLKMS